MRLLGLWHLCGAGERARAWTACLLALLLLLLRALPPLKLLLRRLRGWRSQRMTQRRMMTMMMSLHYCWHQRRAGRRGTDLRGDGCGRRRETWPWTSWRRRRRDWGRGNGREAGGRPSLIKGLWKGGREEGSGGWGECCGGWLAVPGVCASRCAVRFVPRPHRVVSNFGSETSPLRRKRRRCRGDASTAARSSRHSPLLETTISSLQEGGSTVERNCKKEGKVPINNKNNANRRNGSSRKLLERMAEGHEMRAKTLR